MSVIQFFAFVIIDLSVRLRIPQFLFELCFCRRRFFLILSNQSFQHLLSGGGIVFQRFIDFSILRRLGAPILNVLFGLLKALLIGGNIILHFLSCFFPCLGDAVFRCLIRSGEFPLQFRDLRLVLFFFRLGFFIIQHRLNQLFVFVAKRNDVVDLVFKFSFSFPCKLPVNFGDTFCGSVGVVGCRLSALFFRLDFFLG